MATDNPLINASQLAKQYFFYISDSYHEITELEPLWAFEIQLNILYLEKIAGDEIEKIKKYILDNEIANDENVLFDKFNFLHVACFVVNEEIRGGFVDTAQGHNVLLLDYYTADKLKVVKGIGDSPTRIMPVHFCSWELLVRQRKGEL